MIKIEKKDLMIPKILEAHYSSKNTLIDYKLFKLLTELGEANEALLKRMNANNVSSRATDNLEEELIDILLVVLDISLAQIEQQYKEDFFNEREFLLTQIDKLKFNSDSNLDDLPELIWFSEDLHKNDYKNSFMTVLNSLVIEFYNNVISFLSQLNTLNQLKDMEEKEEDMINELKEVMEEWFQKSIKLSTMLQCYIIYHFEVNDMKKLFNDLLKRKLKKWKSKEETLTVSGIGNIDDIGDTEIKSL